MTPQRRALYAAQSAYYTVTGTWPLLSIRTFVALTGPKTDMWLVKMVGALALANGVALGAAALLDAEEPLPVIVAAGSALAFAAIDLVYVARRTIGPAYLGDAAAELAILVGLTLTR